MASKVPLPRKTPPVTDKEAVRRYAVIEQAIRQRDRHQVNDIESAIGMYTIGFHYGWKVLHIVHTKKTIAKYEKLLGINIRDEFEEFGPDADRTNAYKLLQGVTNFWKLVSGEVKPSVDADKRIVL